MGGMSEAGLVLVVHFFRGLHMRPVDCRVAMSLSFLDHLEEHRRVFKTLHVLDGAVQQATARCVAALRGGGRVLACGNGGSVAQAEHFAAELVGRFLLVREALAALVLTGPAAALTSLANDYGFAEVFARQVRGLARAGDCLVLFSTSGQSGADAGNDPRASEQGAGGRFAGLLECAHPLLRTPA